MARSKRQKDRRNVLERKLKAERRAARKFNGALKIFIQCIYPTIYEELCKLYDRMGLEAPGRHDLTMERFQDWQDTNSTGTDMPTAATTCIPTTTTMDMPTAKGMPATATKGQIYVPQVMLEPISIPPVQEDEVHTDIVSQALQEAFGEPMLAEVELPDHEIINDGENIINELLEDPFLRDFLDRDEGGLNIDEGIELNHFDEIALDIEPFDFELEVEQYDF